jgi:signal transduction histidine kinase
MQLNSELERRVAERTAQLEAANKELAAFSYSVSHDLKAPLRGIAGYSHLLEDNAAERLSEEGRLFLRNIRQGVAQMQALIDDLLAYARMERRTLGNEVVDLHASMDAVTRGYARDIAERGITLRSELPRLAVRADREGLFIVLRNLVDNALKFGTNARPLTVELGARDSDSKVILWVRDNGIGFDMKYHERIFEMFSRLQRAEDYSGTGVGLALVRKAVQRMGGRVWAESTPGQGATFFVELPHG